MPLLSYPISSGAVGGPDLFLRCTSISLASTKTIILITTHLSTPKSNNTGQELAAVHSDLKYTALHAAADFGHSEIVKQLIRTGMNVNIRDARKGQTPLHFAGQGGRSEIAYVLVLI